MLFLEFKNLKCIKGVSQSEFDVMALFLQNEVRIPKVSWSLGKPHLEMRQSLMNYLEFN
jgi:hypothetical protein